MENNFDICKKEFGYIVDDQIEYAFMYNAEYRFDCNMYVVHAFSDQQLKLSINGCDIDTSWDEHVELTFKTIRNSATKNTDHNNSITAWVEPTTITFIN